MFQLSLLQKGQELYSLMATGRKDLLWCSVVHLGGLSLLLKVIWYDSIVTCRGWEALSIILSSFLSILLSDTFTKDSSSTLRTEPAFLMSLLSYLSLLSCLSSISCLHPAAPAHYSVEDDAGHHRVIKHLQHGSVDIEWSSESPEKILWPFLYRASVFLVQSILLSIWTHRYLYSLTVSTYVPPMLTGLDGSFAF